MAKQFLLTSINLVYSPISNQVADWLSENENVRTATKQSKFYFIAQREEIFFKNYSLDENDLHISFDLVMGNITKKGLKLSLKELYDSLDDGHELDIELGDQLFRFWDSIDEKRLEVKNWFTTDKLLFDFWKGFIHIENLSNFYDLTTYKLHYIGISKNGDSLSRLFENGHKKRTKILSNENCFRAGARITDELILFLFDLNPLAIKMFENNQDIDEHDFNSSGPNTIKLLADAEKAFVRIMDSKYNEVKYKNYPKCLDGLYEDAIDRYGYKIGEPITFNTDRSSISGDYDLKHGNFAQSDFIAIFDEEVRLMKYDRK